MANLGFATGNELVDAARSEGVSGIATFENNRSSCIREYEFPADTGQGFEKAYRYARDVLGYPEIQSTPGGQKYISRKVPHAINVFRRLTDNQFFLYATRCALSGKAPGAPGFGFDGLEFPEYKHFHYKVTYETLPFDIRGDNQITKTASDGSLSGVGKPDESYWQRYITKIAKPSGEFLTLPVSGGVPPTHSYRWAGTGEAVAPVVERGIGRLLASCNLQVTWHQVPERAVPSIFVNPDLTEPAMIDTTIGKVNNALFNGFRKGTLLLLGVSMNPFRSPFGDRIFDIVFMLKYFEPLAPTSPSTDPVSGHNFVYKPYNPGRGWREVTSDGTGNLSAMTDGKSIYDWANFRDLFRVPQ